MTWLRSLFALLAIALLLGVVAPAAAARPSASCPDTPQVAQLRHGPAPQRPTDSVCMRPVVSLPSLGQCVVAITVCAIDGATGGHLADGVGDAAGEVAGEIVGSAGNAAMDGVAGWFADGVGWVVGKVQQYLEKSTTPKVTAAWYKREYFNMLGLAAALMLPVLMLTLITGLFRADMGALAKAMFVNMPVALIGCAAALAIAQMLLTITDAITTGMTAGYGKDIGDALAQFDKLGKTATGIPGVWTLLLAIVAMIGSFLVFVELIVRSAALYIVLLFLPMAAAVSVWPPAKQIAVKTLTIVVVVIGSKFVICVTFVLGAKAMAMAGTDDGATGIMAGAAMMFLAAASPAVILGMVASHAGEPGRAHLPGPGNALSTAQRINVLRSGLRGSSGSGGTGGRGPSPIGGSGGPSGNAGPAGKTGGRTGGGGGAAAGGVAAAGAGAALTTASALGAKTKASAGDIATDTSKPEGPSLGVVAAPSRHPTAAQSSATPSASPPAKAGGRAVSVPPPTSVTAGEKEPAKAPPHMAGRPSAAKWKELPSV